MRAIAFKARLKFQNIKKNLHSCVKKGRMKRKAPLELFSAFVYEECLDSIFISNKLWDGYKEDKTAHLSSAQIFLVFIIPSRYALRDIFKEWMDGINS